jgi:hypothetical protein
MDGTFVNAIAQLAQEAAGENVVVNIDDRLFSTVQLHKLPKDQEPDLPDAFKIATLQGVVDYIEANRDGLDLSQCMLHVGSPTEVSLVSRTLERAKRATYVKATVMDRSAGFFGVWHDTLDATIKLQSVFEEQGQKAEVLRIVGAVAVEAEIQNRDDGRSQAVATRAGVKVLLGDMVDVPNPVVLAPFRTFPEIVQPASPFIFRMEKHGDKPKIGFFEADGGEWKLDAVAAIAGWLRARCPQMAIIA